MCLKRCFRKLFFCKKYSDDDCEEEQFITSGDMVGARLNRESGLIYSCTNLKDVVPGASYYITGNILNNCERFAINFSYDASGRDIALHVNPRLPQNYIVRNCKINGHWGTEEVTSALPFCLERGKRFTLQVLLTEGEFYISFNGTHFAAFKHRLPYNRIQCLQVKGDVSDVAVEYGNVLEYPDRLSGDDCGTIHDIPVVNYLSTEDIVENIQNAKGNFIQMPFYGKVNSQFTMGTRLHIIGRVKVLPHSFFVNFQRGDKIWPHPIIAFHFNPRFALVGGKHSICRNSWFDGRWDREERSEIKTDFMPSRTFHLIFQITDSAYHVYLNGKLISEYQFRVRADIVDTVYIQGDIKLKAVIFERQQGPDENL